MKTRPLGPSGPAAQRGAQESAFLMDSRPVLLKASGATAGSCSFRDQHGKIQQLHCFLQGPACIQVVPTHYEKMQNQNEEGNSRREVLLAAQECQ